jgi:hypothetical protein
MLAKFEDRTLDEDGQPEDFDPILVGGSNKKALPPQGAASRQQKNNNDDLQVNGTKDDVFNRDKLERDVEEAFDAVQEGEEEDGASQAHRSKKSKKVKKKVKKRKDKKQE